LVDEFTVIIVVVVGSTFFKSMKDIVVVLVVSFDVSISGMVVLVMDINF
jgi:hypothetical protein